MHTHRAVTVVEVLVALIVFSVAATGSAAALTAAARAQRNAANRRTSLAALEAQAASLAAMPCASLATGSGTANGVPVTWSVAVTDSLARITLAAVFGGTRTTLNTEVVCP